MRRQGGPVSAEGQTHARISSVAAVVAVVLALGGMAANFIEWKEAIAISRNEQLRTDRDVAAMRETLKELRGTLDEVRNRKDELPVRLDERMQAMQKQLDRIEQRVKRW